ncbi:MAG TPA: hypothetical protein VFF91_10730 [Pseudoxanthomonas sp.]|nr:hypothetical protein [Pseudoxanthomonas sp.]
MISNLVFLGTFVITACLLLVSAKAVKLLRNRGNRRSPLHGRKIANLPGQQLLSRLNEHGDNMISAFMLMYFSLPLALSMWAILRVDWAAVRFGFTETVFVAAGIGLFGYGLWMYARILSRLSPSERRPDRRADDRPAAQQAGWPTVHGGARHPLRGLQHRSRRHRATCRLCG